MKSNFRTIMGSFLSMLTLRTYLVTIFCLLITLSTFSCGQALAEVGPPPGIPEPPPSQIITDQPAKDNTVNNKAWKEAVSEANKFHFTDLLKIRPLTAFIGLIWFLMVIRSHWKRSLSSRL